MKKQSGFTLIELMVVMAIIAILATAGLSAYTGYIKKARDTKRIADLAAINTIVLWQVSVIGTPPASALDVYKAVVVANNGKLLMDPQSTTSAAGKEGDVMKSVCVSGADKTKTTAQCAYTYRLCDGGVGYVIGARLESTANFDMYVNDGVSPTGGTNFVDATLFEIGSCNAYSTDTPTIINCTAGADTTCTTTSGTLAINPA